MSLHVSIFNLLKKNANMLNKTCNISPAQSSVLVHSSPAPFGAPPSTMQVLSSGNNDLAVAVLILVMQSVATALCKHRTRVSCSSSLIRPDWKN